MADARKLNIVDEDGNVIGEATRDEIHKEGLLHREVHVWFYTPNGEIIFQHRSKDADTWPDLLDATVGGHVEIGQDDETAALEEMKEETGITVDMRALTPILTTRSKRYDPATGKTNNALLKIYCYRFECALEDLRIEEGKALGFEAWPFDRLFHASEEDTQRLIPMLHEKKSLDMFRKIQKLAAR